MQFERLGVLWDSEISCARIGDGCSAAFTHVCLHVVYFDLHIHEIKLQQTLYTLQRALAGILSCRVIFGGGCSIVLALGLRAGHVWAQICGISTLQEK